jgi:hypothetical protein
VARGISSFMHVTGGYGHPLPDTIFVVDLGGRGRFDHLQRRPWLWRAANSAGVAAEAVAVSPAFWSAINRVRRHGPAAAVASPRRVHVTGREDPHE